MKKIFLLFLIITCFSNSSFSQSRYIVRFKDKGTNPFSLSNPSANLTNRAIQRRTRYSIVIDSTDLPVTPRYVDSIRLAGAVAILNTSKWLNQVAIQTSDAAALIKINSFPFVAGTSAAGNTFIQPVNKLLNPPYIPEPATPQTPQGLNDFYNYGQSYGQVHIHNGEFLHNHGFRGEGMQMTILDAGFFHYLSLPTFDSVRNNGQILGTWDFVDRNASVDEDHQHGMNCFSTISANMPGVFVGQAPKASYYLYRTEDAATENPVEEQNWAAGAERADSLGVDVFTTSLGYTTFDNPVYNHTYADMNGNTTIIAKASDMAAKKGILVLASAGNDGNGGWHFIGTPADADSIIAVGAVSVTGAVAGFSSYGPSSDGQIKPSVAAVGAGAVIANPSNGQPTFGNGTSFSCPNMAGIATCLWQAFPEVNNMSIIDVLQKSASKALSPDDRVGYGIPDMKKAFVLLEKKLYTQQAAINNCKTVLQWAAKTDTGITFIVERKLASGVNYAVINTQVGTGSFALRNFSYTDDLASVALGSIKYRISMKVSADTTFYLDSVTVNYSQTCNVTVVEKITISPNPVSDKLTVKIVKNNAAKVSIVVHTASGQKIYTVINQQAAGTQTYTIPMKEMSRGAYFVSVFIDDKKEITKKILRQ